MMTHPLLTPLDPLTQLSVVQIKGEEMALHSVFLSSTTAFVGASDHPHNRPQRRRGRRWQVMGVAHNAESRRMANLQATRKEKVTLPDYTDCQGRAFEIGDFLSHPSGVEALLNTRALQSFQCLGSNTYRCTLQKIQFLKFDMAPVVDLRVIPTNDDCVVELLSCKFEGSEMEQQNQLFSAFMTNHIKWEANGSGPYLEMDVNMKITLEVYTKPFNMLPISVVEKPGNLVMQGLLDKLVPLLAEQLLKDYGVWVEEQLQLSSIS